MTDCVRPFTDSDIPHVADLHRRVFRPDATRSNDEAQRYRTYFGETFLHGPWRDAACPSLVYVDDHGRIGGFVGVVSRAMRLNGRPLRMAVSSQFMVDVNLRSVVAAVRLIKAFLAGPQDLSLADEATERARWLWETVGGTTAQQFSLAWVRVLRPAAFVASRARRHRALAVAARASAPICRLTDAVVARLPGPFGCARPTLVAEDLDGAALRACIDEASSGLALRPYYDDRSADVLLGVISRKQGAGELRKVVLRDERGRVAGWYLYHATRGGVGEVLQVGGRPQSSTDVLDHLFFDAWQQGVAALCGRLDPALMSAMAARHCFFHHRGEWVLIHSRVAGALDAVHRGEAFLSRLEGEWCLRYRLGFA
ncbi:MAG: GNAT family N-acetyltransferase [Acidobacteria bacterium]|nr:GNAT family N-acetyltransferase [Acidobacteriota bacterium]